MSIDHFKSIQKLTDHEISKYLEGKTYTDDMSELAFLHLVQYLNWYKVKYRNECSAEVHNLILKDLVEKFPGTETQKLSAYLNSNRIYDFSYVIFALMIFMPIIIAAILIFTNLNLLIKFGPAIFIAYYSAFILFCGIYSYTNAIHFYSIKGLLNEHNK